MSRASNTYLNAALDGAVATTAFLSIHTADPGTTGASEVSGGSYARQAVSWSAAASGVKSNSASTSTPIPISTTISFFGTWSLVTAGVYAIGGPLSATITFVTAGSFTIAAAGLTVTGS